MSSIPGLGAVESVALDTAGLGWSPVARFRETDDVLTSIPSPAVFNDDFLPLLCVPPLKRLETFLAHLDDSHDDFLFSGVASAEAIEAAVAVATKSFSNWRSCCVMLVRIELVIVPGSILVFWDGTRSLFRNESSSRPLHWSRTWSGMTTGVDEKPVLTQLTLALALNVPRGISDSRRVRSFIVEPLL